MFETSFLVETRSDQCYHEHDIVDIPVIDFASTFVCINSVV